MTSDALAGVVRDAKVDWFSTEELNHLLWDALHPLGAQLRYRLSISDNTDVESDPHTISVRVDHREAEFSLYRFTAASDGVVAVVLETEVDDDRRIFIAFKRVDEVISPAIPPAHEFQGAKWEPVQRAAFLPGPMASQVEGQPDKLDLFYGLTPSMLFLMFDL